MDTEHHKKLSHKKHLTLKRDLGLFYATACGVGLIVGAGIYVLIGAATGLAGNSVWISFILAAIVAALTGLSYAELSSMFPKDAGEYLYAEKAFGKRLGFFTGYSVMMWGIITAAVVALGFAGYFAALFSTNSMIITAAILIMLFSLINYYGIKQSAILNLIFTILEVGGLILIILFAIKFVGKVDYMEAPFGVKGIFSAAALIFFAYTGFESIVKLSEETKNPKKIIPKAIILSILITVIIYCLVAVAAISVLDWKALAVSKAPLADVANAVMGSRAFLLLAVIALFSTANTVLIILITTSRTLYGIAHDFSLLSVFTKISEKRRTPSVAIFVIMVLAILFALIGDIKLIAEITNFSIFLTFFIVNLALIWLRYKLPEKERKFKVPLNIKNFPVLSLLGAAFCIFMIFNLERIVILGGLVLVAIGLISYEILKNKEKKSLL